MNTCKAPVSAKHDARGGIRQLYIINRKMIAEKMSFK